MKTDTLVKCIGKKHYGKIGVVANDYYKEQFKKLRKNEVIVDFAGEDGCGGNVFIIKKKNLEVLNYRFDAEIGLMNMKEGLSFETKNTLVEASKKLGLDVTFADYGKIGVRASDIYELVTIARLKMSAASNMQAIKAFNDFEEILKKTLPEAVIKIIYMRLIVK